MRLDVSPVIAATLVLDKLTRLVNSLAAGEACGDVAPFLAGAPIYALKKPDGGVRPIAVGETLRRLVSKCCSASAKKAAQQLLEPRQLGGGTRAGAEVVVRAVNAVVTEHGHDPTLAMLKIDFENAFNSIDRSTLLKELDTEMPQLSPWARWCYEDDSHLWFEQVLIDSSEGVQQSDPLGPLLFALGLRTLTSKIKERWPGLLLHAWYLDDGILIGKRDALAEVLEFLRGRAATNLNLKVNLPKCEVWWPSGDPIIPEVLAAVPRAAAEGTEVLNIHVGTDSFIANRLRVRVSKCRV